MHSVQTIFAYNIFVMSKLKDLQNILQFPSESSSAQLLLEKTEQNAQPRKFFNKT
jgi:hypothetical protein